jgi:hypothetical protein
MEGERVSSLLFHRTCVVEVTPPDGGTGIRVEGLRVEFKAVKSLKKEPNTLDLKIFNLAESTRAAMKKKGSRVILTAGYESNAAVIFSGDARTIDHVRTVSDWETHIQCGDGERAYQFSRMSQSFGAGTSVGDVVRACARQLGLGMGNVEAALAKGGFRGNLSQFVHGYAAHGRASAELDRILRTLGLGWSVQDGALQVLKDSDTANGTAVLLTAGGNGKPGTGLIGSPDHGTPDAKGKPSVLKVKCLLNPQIKCGGVVQLDAIGAKGAYKVDKLDHEGDTEGGKWYTSLECFPL